MADQENNLSPKETDISAERIVFENSRGLKLIGDFYGSTSNTGIVIAHGLGSDRHGSYNKFDNLAKLLNSDGFNVLTFDFTASGESQGDVIKTEYEMDDLSCAINIMKKRGLNELGLLGSSMGGFISSSVYPNYRDDIKTMVLWSPVTNKMENPESYYGDEQKRELLEKGVLTVEDKTRVRKKVGIDKEVFEAWKRINQRELLSKIACPVLVIQGDRDERIPLNDSQQALSYLFPKSQLIIVRGAEHSPSDKNLLDQFMQATNNWFKKYLPH